MGEEEIEDNHSFYSGWECVDPIVKDGGMFCKTLSVCRFSSPFKVQYLKESS